MSDRWSSIPDQLQMLDVYRDAQVFYRGRLMERPGKWVAAHLERHGLDPAGKADAGWRIGYAPDEPDQLVERLRQSAFSDEVILGSGLAVAADSGHLIDRFRDCLMFAVRDSVLAEVGFVGRRRTEATYLDTPESSFYRKSETLIGVAEQQEELADGAVPVIVNGPMAALALRAIGEIGAWAGVAVHGTSLSPLQAASLRHYATSDTVVVALGNGQADRQASARMLPLLAKEFTTVSVADLPRDRDPRTPYLADDDPSILRDALQFGRPLASLVIDLEVEKRAPGHQEMTRAATLREIARVVLRSPADAQDKELARISRRLGLDVVALAHEVQQLKRTKSTLRAARPAIEPRDPEPPTTSGPAL